MRISNIDETFLDYPDNKDISLIVFMPGCQHNCKDCQNKELQNPDNGKLFTLEEAVKEIEKQAMRSRTDKIVLSGGDPLSFYNIDNTIRLLDKLKGFDICIYTGYDIDYVKENHIKNFKFIKCGIYDETKAVKSYKDDNGIQFASTNQKLYDSNYNLLSEEGYYKFKE